MRSKEVGDIYQLHITVASGTPAHKGNASVFSNCSLSAPVTPLSPEDSVAPTVFSGEAHMPLSLSSILPSPQLWLPNPFFFLL